MKRMQEYSYVWQVISGVLALYTLVGVVIMKIKTFARHRRERHLHELHSLFREWHVKIHKQDRRTDE